MSLYSYGAGSGSKEQKDTRPARSLYPSNSSSSISDGKRPSASKLFQIPVDDFEDIDNMSDLENMNFGNIGRPLEARTLSLGSGGNSNGAQKTGNLISGDNDRGAMGSRNSSRDMSVEEPAGEPVDMGLGRSGGKHKDKEQASMVLGKYESQSKPQSLAAAYKSYQGDQDAPLTATIKPGASAAQAESAGATETPAYKLPPHPVQGSTVTSRWKRRGRLGLAKPKRCDPGTQSEEHSQSIDGEGSGMGMGVSPPNSIDFMNGSSASIDSKPFDRLARSPPRSMGSAYAGSSIDLDSHRNSYLSVDESSIGDVEQTFNMSRMQSKNPSLMSSSNEPLRSSQGTSYEIPIANRSMDISDVSMNSNSQSRSHSPDPISATKTPVGSGVPTKTLLADEFNSTGKRTADSRGSDNADNKDGSVPTAGDSARRRAVSPLHSRQRRMVSPSFSGSASAENINQRHDVSGSPRISRNSPIYNVRSAASQEKRSSAYGDSAMEIAVRFEQHEKKTAEVSPQYRSPRERPQQPLLGSALRSSDPSQASQTSRSDDIGGRQQQYTDQHSMSEPKPHRYGQPKVHSGSSSARLAERHTPTTLSQEQPQSQQIQSSSQSREDMRPEYFSAGHSSPKLQFARRSAFAENNFDALRKNASPVVQQEAGFGSKAPPVLRSEEQARPVAMGLPQIEDKVVLQEQYVAAISQATQQSCGANRPARNTPPEAPQVGRQPAFDRHPADHIQVGAVPVQQQPSPISQLAPLSAAISESQSQSQSQPQQQQQQPSQQIQRSQQSQQSQQPQQQAGAFGGIDPKRTLMVNRRAYQKISITGRGGSSKVYKAMSTKHEIFAIKRVSFSRADVQAIEGYMNEIILLRKFEGNPHIIQLYDAEINKERGLLHMVMEFGETDLANVLKRQGDRPLGMNMIRLYWEQMLRAVQTIHEERVVHADLKPANYLLVRGSLKLIDFGIAKAIGNDTTNIHRENQIGTVNYMSPEAIKETNTENGKRLMKLGRASDIWSLGIILYQMCYGRTPFAQLALFKKLASIPDPNFVIPFPRYMAGCLQVGTDRDPNIDSGPRYPDGTEKIPVPPDLMHVMKHCLQRDPEKRMTIPDLLVDPLLCPISLEHALPSAMSQMLSLLKRNPQVLEQWDISEPQNEKVLAYLVRTLREQEQGKQV
ncbi:Dual-specificity kinase, spindle pole body (SPB) duplication and spindle checkpoint function [Coemansia sp. RSA 2599]|nr:Dual-specificity kinase, spindle pole body (SPB) duplication and spindle checkpoint function [Coemansia sp. RSA 2599]